MSRQQSLHSFFSKPPTPNPNAGPYVSVTDTPPGESVISGGSRGPGGRSRVAVPFADLMRKFSREPSNQDCTIISGSDVQAEKADGGKEARLHETFNFDTQQLPYVSRLSDSSNKVVPTVLDFEAHEMFGSERTSIQPLVPGLKRVKENHCGMGDGRRFLVNESSKRVKVLGELGPPNKSEKTLNDFPGTTSSKFEWLNPSFIKDAKGRKNGDALYDKRTLYIPPGVFKKMSATQKQYWDIKRQYMDVVLFFKVGKFYELYELDAEIGQKELDWKMTHSGVGKCRQVGIPESGIDDAIQKLVARGYKVGRIEQMETLDKAKQRGATSVIQRKLINICSPSTMTDESVGPDSLHLLVLKEELQRSDDFSAIYGFAFVDCAALKIWVGSICDDASCAALGALLVQVSPKEVVYENGGLSKKTLKAIKKYGPAGQGSVQLTPIPSMGFRDAFEVTNFVQLQGYFRESSSFWSSAVDCQVNFDLSICALGGLISYLSRLKIDDALCNGELIPYHVYKSCLKMDGQTLVNLEIFSNNVNGGLSGTLYKHLDHCITSSGKRLLRRWICHPLKSMEEINDRLNVVEGLIQNPGLSYVISDYLCKLPDLERFMGRVKGSVCSSATVMLPNIGFKVLKRQVKSFGYLIKGFCIGLELLTLIVEDNHGLPFQKVLNIPLLSEINEFLKQFEVAVLDKFPQYQDHDVEESDAETLSQLIEFFLLKVTEWSQIIKALSCIDVLNSFAMVASLSEGCMSRPVVLPVGPCVHSSKKIRGSVLKIEGLWHPYAAADIGGSLVPNDVQLGEDDNGCHPRALLLTGPNMGGKSTLLRASCLVVILAQLGCFVPCDSCTLSPADVIFTRLGAMDRIMSGESTFFIECAETASVLENATKDSLVLLDELGRGTSTFDGYAIAYAVFRHLVEKVHCRLLFTTHYHPLTKEFASHPLVSLQHMACAFKPRVAASSSSEMDLVFLYRLVPGACPESYGLQVALMAGVPRQVVEVASKASARMKLILRENFKSSEGRSMFSTLEEDHLRTLLAVSKANLTDGLDEDSFDILFCLWHELKSLYKTEQGVV